MNSIILVAEDAICEVFYVDVDAQPDVDISVGKGHTLNLFCCNTLFLGLIFIQTRIREKREYHLATLADISVNCVCGALPMNALQTLCCRIFPHSGYHQISNWKFGSCLWWAHPVTVMVVAVMVVVDMKVDMKATKLIQGRKARVDIK